MVFNLICLNLYKETLENTQETNNSEEECSRKRIERKHGKECYLLAGFFFKFFTFCVGAFCHAAIYISHNYRYISHNYR